MAHKRKPSVSSSGLGPGGGSGTGGTSSAGAAEGSVLLSRQRERKRRYDQQGHPLINVGVLFREDLYAQYRRIAFFRHQNTYDLINQALEAYLPTLKGSTTQKLREAGQESLEID